MPFMPHLTKNMFKKYFLGISCLIVCLHTFAQTPIGPLGQWREHYNNKSVLALVKGDLLYGATPNQVFSIDTKNNINFLGKSTGLNEIEVSAIAWDEAQAQLMIAYKNSNIDKNIVWFETKIFAHPLGEVTHCLGTVIGREGNTQARTAFRNGRWAYRRNPITCLV